MKQIKTLLATIVVVLFSFNAYAVDFGDKLNVEGPLDVKGTFSISGTAMTASATELNQLDADSTNSMQTLTKTVELTNAEIKALAATPKELVAAPGAGKMIEFVSALLVLDYGSNALTEPSDPDDLAIEYDGGSGTQIATWGTTAFITATADFVELVNSADIAGVASATNTNKNLVLINTGGEYAGNAANDTTISVMVSYRIHTLGL